MFPISDWAQIIFGDPSQQWATLIRMEKKLVKIEKKTFLQSVFGRNFFLPKNQLFTPEMDSWAKTKYKTIKR
jgi:hypothetical protein